MSRVLISCVLALSCLVASCAGESSRPAMAVAAAESDGGDSSAGRKLVRTARLEIVVDDPEASRTLVQALITGKGGFVERVEAHSTERSMDWYLLLRVPSDRLEEVFSAIRAMADQVVSEAQEVKDVTDRSIDIDARLTSLNATEKELLALLAESRQRAGGIEEIMAVHRELTEIRTKIERIEGERKALDGQVSFATIELELRTHRPAGLLAHRWRPVRFAGQCLVILVMVLKFLGYALIFAVIVVVPAGLLIWLPLRFFRRWRASRKPPGPPLATTA